MSIMLDSAHSRRHGLQRRLPIYAFAIVFIVATVAFNLFQIDVGLITTTTSSWKLSQHSRKKADNSPSDAAVLMQIALEAGSQEYYYDSNGTAIGRIAMWERALQIKEAAARTLKYVDHGIRPAPPVALFRVNKTREEEQLHQHEKNKPVVAVITSTRSISSDSILEETLLSRLLVQSIAKTVTQAEQGNWTIRLYIAVDSDDEWWLQHYHELVTPHWLTVTFGVFEKVRPQRVPFSEIAYVAYQEGAEYFCRINDDTEFLTTAWITAAVSALEGYDPPNLGMVGPKCGQGNTAILTHDFVHRTHMDIFEGNYYPQAFDNWWLDDWITVMYSSQTLGPDINRNIVPPGWEVAHHLTVTRYTPSSRLVTQWLPVEYERGRRKIARYLREHYPHHPLVEQHKVFSSVPKPVHVDPSAVEAILKALSANNGNLLVWGLDRDDSQFWHLATTGRVTFLEHDPSLRGPVCGTFPWLECFDATRPGDNSYEGTYREFVRNQTLDNNTWCELTMPNFPSEIRSTFWDVILVLGRSPKSPGIFQQLYMSQVLVANQMTLSRSASLTGNNSSQRADSRDEKERVTHIFVGDYEREYERVFSTKLFAKQPEKVMEIEPEPAGDHPAEDEAEAASARIVTAKQVAHFIIDPRDRTAMEPQQCSP
jgi:hypothetical protein